MNLEVIKTNTNWSEASDSLRQNFTRISVEIEKLKSATTNNKGLYPDLNSLTEAHTSPDIGSYAYVGTNSPYSVYRYSDDGWIDTGDTFYPIESIGNYYTKSEIDYMISTIGGNVMLEEAQGYAMALQSDDSDLGDGNYYTKAQIDAMLSAISGFISLENG